jgi:TonB-dependent starch-binding outer membrane protein SusC
MAALRRILPAVVIALMCAVQVQAQAVGRIHGTVVDSANRQPLPNVNVGLEGTTRGAVSRVDGTFDVTGVPPGTYSLRARRIGYRTIIQSVTVTAGSTTNVDLGLGPQPTVLAEIVSTGYGTQRREAITGSVATVNADAANVGVITNAEELLQGRTTGVQVVKSSGEPGGNIQIRIRGGTSISASNDPLYVIDGVPVQNDSPTPDAAGVNFNAALPRNPLNGLSPDDIETLTILKDASATAIYGSRAANGVVLITTKRGTRDSQIEYEVYAGASSPTKTLGLASGAQYRAFVTQFKDSLGGQTAVDALGGADTDWEKAVTHSSLAMNHNLAFSGGAADTKYRASLNYFDQEGAVVNSALKRYQGRLNATHDAVNGRLHVGLNLMASRVDNQFSPNENGGGFNGGLFTNMIIYNPTFPIDCSGKVKPCTGNSSTYFENGVPGVFNPVALIHQVEDNSPVNRILGNFTGTVSLLENLTSQTTLGADNSNAERRTFFPQASPAGSPFGGYARQVNRSLQSLTFQQLVTFSPHFSGSQEFEVAAGYEFLKNDNREVGTASQGFISDVFNVDNLVAGSTVPTGYPYSWHNEDDLSSFFARANYGYAGRYFLTGVLRRDGSSRLSPGPDCDPEKGTFTGNCSGQWALFPGISGSWRMSEENFMRNRPLGVSSLALRAGWGKQGNQSIAPYQTLLLLRADPSALYPFGGVITSGLAAAQVGNPNLKWETATQTNLGVDFGFKNDRITGAVEIYQKNTNDLLLSVAVPQPAVVPTQLENIGSLRNRGLEANVDWQMYNSGRRSLTGGLVFTLERNMVTSLGDTTAACTSDNTANSFAAAAAAKCTTITTGTVNGQGQSNQWSQIIMRGQAIGTFLAPKFIGVTGGVQYFSCTSIDANCKNGQTTSPVDADRQFIGSANPSFTLGLRHNATWNAWDASWLWRGEFGGKVFNNTALVYESKSDAAQGRNFLAAAISDPDNIHEPAKFSSRWIEDRTFVRLQNLSVGYTLPKTFLGGRSTRAFVSADNLLLFSHYSGYDPEVFTSLGLASRGIDYLTYPRTRSFTVGARTQF